MKLRALPPWTPLAAIFAASFVAVHAWSGASPAHWLDTINDQREVRRCVLEGSCSLIGQAASIDGLFVAGGWLHLRSLFFALGVGLDGVHLLLQTLDALGVALVALAGFRLGGRAVGATAAAVLMLELGRTAATREAVYNTSPLAFFGAVLLLAALAAVQRPGFGPAVALALLAAVMADCHVCCAPAGVTVVGVALLAPGTPRRRLLRAGVAAAVCAAAAFAMAPVQWIEDVRFALHPRGGGGHAPVALGVVASVVREDGIAWCSLVGVVAWALAAVARRTVLRRRLDVAVLVVAPMLAIFVAAVRHGVGDSGGKYLAHVKPAAALAVAVILVGAARWLAGRSALLGRQLPRAARFLPWAAALAIGLSARDGVGRGGALFTVRDVDAVARALRDERGWSRAQIVRHVQALDQPSMIAAVLGDDPRRDPPGPPPSDDPTDAFVLVLDVADLPDPLPPSWKVANRASDHAAVIVFARSRLDWPALEMCTEARGERRCLHEADVGPDGPAMARLSPPGHITLRVPLLPGPPGRLFMPRLMSLCGGIVVAVTGPGSHVEEGGRRAALGPDGGEVELGWELGSTACREHFPIPRPPFFVEGDAETVSSLEAVMRRHEP